MKSSRYFIFLTFLFLFIGCSYKIPIQKSQSYIITMKMRDVAFSDMGFLNYGKDYIDLQLFSAGSLVLELEISKNICINSHCFSKKEFNNRFLSKEYNSNILENILNHKPIFNQKGYEKHKDGFSQIIREKNIDIKYFVSKDKIYFKDYKNHILIKLTPIGR